MSGVLGLSRREGNRRVYDLIERLFPAELLAHEVPVAGAGQAQAAVALPRARPAGSDAAPASCGSALGKAKRDPGQPDQPADELREELVEAGELVPVEVEGVRGERFVLREEVELG